MNKKEDIKKIYVTRPYLPPIDKYKKFIDRIFFTRYLTNNGPFVREFQERLREYLNVKYLVLVANGTLALQVSYKLLNLKGEVITTPFSFVATVSSIVWEGLEPVFADIDPDTLTINPEEIEKKITDKTTAIVPVHVYGNICDIEKIEKIAKKNNLKVVYDAAHAFGIKYKGKSVLNYGDVSIVSFHATKLFHTIEGGAIIVKDEVLYRKAKQMINFGYERGKIKGLGINAKMNEFEAAMGLCILDDIDQIIEKRRIIWEYYYKNLKDIVKIPKLNKYATYNYGYFPIIFETENDLLEVMRKMNDKDIFPRRYFYPSLDNLNYIKSKHYNKVANDIARRVLCLPLYFDLDRNVQDIIIDIIRESI